MNEDIQIEVGREGEALEPADAFHNVAKQLSEVANNIEAAEAEIYPESEETEEIDLMSDDDGVIRTSGQGTSIFNVQEMSRTAAAASEYTRMRLREQSMMSRLLPSTNVAPSYQGLSYQGLRVGDTVILNPQGQLQRVLHGEHHITSGVVLGVTNNRADVSWNQPIGAMVTQHDLPASLPPAPPIQTMRLEVYQTASGQMVLRDEVTKVIVSNVVLESVDHQVPRQDMYSLGDQRPYQIMGRPSVRIVLTSISMGMTAHESAPTPPAVPLPEVTVPPQSESTREIEVTL